MRSFFLTALFVVLTAQWAWADPQDSSAVNPGTTLVEVGAGHTAFADDGAIHHLGLNGAIRVYVTPRISIGAELSYQIGPGQDRDVMPLVVLTTDLREARPGETGRVEPYALLGAGLIGHGSGYGPSVWPTLTFGGGARVWMSPRLYATADARLGWPPYTRIVTGVGVLLR